MNDKLQADYVGVAQDKSTEAVTQRMLANSDEGQGNEPGPRTRPSVAAETQPPAPPSSPVDSLEPSIKALRDAMMEFASYTADRRAHQRLAHQAICRAEMHVAVALNMLLRGTVRSLDDIDRELLDKRR